MRAAAPHPSYSYPVTPELPIAVEAMKNGACHFLAKPVGDAQLLQAIDQVRSQCIRRDVTT